MVFKGRLALTYDNRLICCLSSVYFGWPVECKFESFSKIKQLSSAVRSQFVQKNFHQSSINVIAYQTTGRWSSWRQLFNWFYITYYLTEHKLYNYHNKIIQPEMRSNILLKTINLCNRIVACNVNTKYECLGTSIYSLGGWHLVTQI